MWLFLPDNHSTLITRSFTIRHFDTSQSVLLQQWEIPIVEKSRTIYEDV